MCCCSGFMYWSKLSMIQPAQTPLFPGHLSALKVFCWSPFWANLHPYAELARRARRAPTWRDAAQVWLRPPEWRATWDAPDARMPGYGEGLPRGVALYSLIQLALALAASLALLWPSAATTGAVRAALIVFVLTTLVTVAAFWDHRPWARRAEAYRLAAVAAGAITLALMT